MLCFYLLVYIFPKYHHVLLVMKRKCPASLMLRHLILDNISVQNIGFLLYVFYFLIVNVYSSLSYSFSFPFTSHNTSFYFNFILHFYFLLIQQWKVKVAQSGLTVWDFMNYTIHRILLARILEWVACPAVLQL